MRWQATCVASVLLAGLVAAAWMPGSSAQAPLTGRGPILIDGDADVCNVEDVVDGRDVPDGIVNCSTADGTPANPYVIRGWNITWDPLGPCRVSPDDAVCPALPPCSFTSVPAALAICGTRKHLVVEEAAVWNAEAARRLSPQVVPAAAITLSNVDNLLLRNIEARAAGVGIFAEPGKPVATLSKRTGGVVFEDVFVQVWFDKAEGRIMGPLPDQGFLPDLNLVTLTGLNSTFLRAHVDARTRDVGFQANASGGANRIEIRDSLFTNASSQAAIILVNMHSVLEGNVFRENGLQAGAESGASIETSAVDVSGGRVALRANTFELQGFGVTLRRDVEGQLRENRFLASGTRIPAMGVFQDSSGLCGVAINYNELHNATIANSEASGCRVDARYNWWSGERMVNGAVDWEPMLSHRLEQLPVVTIERPRDATQVHGRIFVHGSWQVESDYQVQRIEATSLENEWEGGLAVEATDPWTFAWDVPQGPLGPLSLFVRACATGDDCGLPTRLDLVVIDRPIPPIGLLTASPRVVRPDELVTLNATLSYSPQGRSLKEFRFDLGNGFVLPWQPAPSYEARFAAPGEFPVSVQVRDEHGLVSENLPQVVVRVLGDGIELKHARGTPTVPMWIVVVLLIGVAGWLSRGQSA